MSTLATDVPIAQRPATRPRRLPLIAAACLFAATAMFDLTAHPYLGEHRSHAASTYTLTALLIPFAAAMLWTLAELRSRGPAKSRLATTALSVAGAGLLLFIPCAIVSLATANPQALGPVYMLAMLLSVLGTTLLAFALTRSGVLARWVAIGLPAAWIIGGPAGEGGILRGAALLLAAVLVGIAATPPALATD